MVAALMHPALPLSIMLLLLPGRQPAPLEPGDVYAESFVFELPGSVQHTERARGRRALFLFRVGGHVDVLECGLTYDTKKARLRAELADAFLEHGTWTETQSGEIVITLGCSRFPLPPGAPSCTGPEKFVFQRIGSRERGRLGEALGPMVSGNMRLTARPDLDNFSELRRVVDRKHH